MCARVCSITIDDHQNFFELICEQLKTSCSLFILILPKAYKTTNIHFWGPKNLQTSIFQSNKETQQVKIATNFLQRTK